MLLVVDQVVIGIVIEHHGSDVLNEEGQPQLVLERITFDQGHHEHEERLLGLAGEHSLLVALLSSRIEAFDDGRR